MGLVACSSLSKDDETKDWSAAKLYDEAKLALNEGDYPKAVDHYESLEARYPFGRYTQQGQIDLAYVHYRNNEPDLALAAADRFIKLYPGHPRVDYAYYLKGLVNDARGTTLLQRYLPVDATQRDPGLARDAFKDFAEVVNRFPNSPYAEDSRQRLLALRNRLADYEMHVARYYFKRGAYVAAAERAQYVVEHYQRTPAIPEALSLLAQCYQAMGLDPLSADAQRVYALNYGNQATPTRERHWWDWFGLDRD
jgi:outer membrane protein assembly factor BamD